MISLKKDIDPRFGIVAVILVVVISGYFLWHANSEKPAYIGLNAPHPAAEMSGGKQDLSHATPANANQMRIPGRSFNPDNPNATPGGGQMPAQGNKPGS